jgi:aconitate hydratase
MARNVAQKLIDAHLVAGHARAGQEIALRIDQTLTQDATGTLVMLALEAMQLDRARTEVSAQYVDHNLLQTDFRNADDHLFLASACRRFGLQFSPPGGGVSHPVHMERLGVPGKTLLGADSHTCASGALGMLAIGTGGLDVALAIAGEPFTLKMPLVWGIRLIGKLPAWVSAKDVILELLRRHGVRGGRGRILEYHGPGLAALDAMDRHVIANMGAELGATTSVFPSDARTREFLAAQGREHDWQQITADQGADYDIEETIDLATLEPLIAKPSSPGNVVPVREVAGTPISQAYVGSSANPGFRDLAVAAEIVRGKQVHPGVSFDINPASRQVLMALTRSGLLAELLAAGARLHQVGCNGCIGMGQAPATGRNSLRTVPRNFPGRSGTREDSVWLCSPETAAASALAGAIVDPRELGRPWFSVRAPDRSLLTRAYQPPAPAGAEVALVKGPNIASLPELDPLPAELELVVLLALGDDVSTDEILPAGGRVLPYRSNIPKIAEFCFEGFDAERGYFRHARDLRDAGRWHAVVAGSNYGQGSSREHAALAPRYLGLRTVLARSFARIHRANLINYGVLPLLYTGDALAVGEVVLLHTGELAPDAPLTARIAGGKSLQLGCDLSARELEVVRAGGRIAWARARLQLRT